MDDPRALQHDLLMCVADGNIDGVRNLIDGGANINHVWGGGEELLSGPTALSLAIYSMRMNTNPSMNMVNELLALGADASAGHLGYRPLDCALRVFYSDGSRIPAHMIARNRALAKRLLRAGAATTGIGEVEESPAKKFVAQVLKRGGWKKYARWHKQVLVGLVTKCRPMPDDAAGLVVDFYCPSGGS